MTFNYDYTIIDYIITDYNNMTVDYDYTITDYIITDDPYNANKITCDPYNANKITYDPYDFNKITYDPYDFNTFTWHDYKPKSKPKQTVKPNNSVEIEDISETFSYNHNKDATFIS